MIFANQKTFSQQTNRSSPRLSTLVSYYYTELLKDIEANSKSGTSLYGHYTGITMYADDTILMSITLNGLQKLVDECWQEMALFAHQKIYFLKTLDQNVYCIYQILSKSLVRIKTYCNRW